jgi:hypothetical protein
VDGHHAGFIAEALLDSSLLLDEPESVSTANRVRVTYRAALVGYEERPLLYSGRRRPVGVITGAQERRQPTPSPR